MNMFWRIVFAVYLLIATIVFTAIVIISPIYWTLSGINLAAAWEYPIFDNKFINYLEKRTD